VRDCPSIRIDFIMLNFWETKMNKSALLAFAAVLALPAAWAGDPQIDSTQAPTGTHLQSGTIGCTPEGLTVTCSAYELAGVGNTNATAKLTATYIGTVICTNHGDNVAPGQTQPKQTGTTVPNLRAKNGRLTVPVLVSDSSLSTISTGLMENTSCPNDRNWKKSVDTNTIRMIGYTYTLKFDGYTSAYITISG
jgi:hypothetical protein